MINVFISSFFYCLTISGYMWFISDDESVCVRFWNKNLALPISENLRINLNGFEFGEILSLIPVVGCLRQCWPSSTERGWERVKKEFLGERIKVWAVGSLRGSFEVGPTIRLGPGAVGPTFEALDRPMQLRLPQTYRFPAFSYYPGTISVAKRILNLNCPLNFWATDSFEVKNREKVELSIFYIFQFMLNLASAGRPVCIVQPSSNWWQSVYSKPL